MTLLLALQSGAAAFHVDCETGRDSNDGRSAARAWQTIGRANLQTYGPGVKYNTGKPFESPDVRLKNATRNGKLLTKAEKNDILRKGLFWKIGGRPHRMSKVIRIPYTYKDPITGKPGRQTALIIGYEGAGGGC